MRVRTRDDGECGPRAAREQALELPSATQIPLWDLSQTGTGEFCYLGVDVGESRRISRLEGQRSMRRLLAGLSAGLERMPEMRQRRDAHCQVFR